MRTRIVAGLAVLTLAAAASDAGAVPSFTRQTGMTCNQCHVSFGGPVPNFTFTGKKFRVNGYRMPYIIDKIEAGEPGKSDGNRLSMPLTPYLSLRYQSSLLAQSKAPGAVEAGPITSNPTSRLAIFPAGAVGDHIGLWVELYLIPEGNTDREWGFGLFSFDEYDLRFVKITENATLGLSVSNQTIKEIGGFGPWGLASEMSRGGVGGYAHPNRGNFFAYGWFNDQILAVVGASPGENNLDWEGRNYQAQLARAPLHSDANEAWLAAFVQFGDDGIPIVSNTGIRGTATGPSWTYSDAVAGITATRAAPATGARTAYLTADMGDHFRSLFEARYGFIDRGPHSVENAIGISINKETYSDNAEYSKNQLSARSRYVYNRTWGAELQVSKHLTNEFTSFNGTKYDIDDKLAWTTYLSYKPAMNFLLVFTGNNTQSLALTQATGSVPTGWSWGFSIDFLF